jgi:hypothetical protein
MGFDFRTNSPRPRAALLQPRYCRFFGPAAAVLLLAALTGCLYPDSMRGENRGTGAEYVSVVQTAVDQYVAANSVLPIKNSTLDTPIYEKYVIDFGKLLDTPYLSVVPPNAFEKGGTNLYVLVDVETKPLVRLLDLRTAQAVNDVQRKVDAHRHAGGGVPLGDPTAAGWHAIDYGMLGMSPVQVKSVFSGRFLTLLINREGNVIVDYGPDLMTLIQSKALQPKPDSDLRSLLVEHSLYVPVKSAAYYWRNNEPAIAAG